VDYSKYTKTRIKSINGKHQLFSNTTSGVLMIDSLTPGKKKDGSVASKMQNYATVTIDEKNDILSTTTDKRTTDDRIENSHRNKKKIDVHKESKTGKTIQKIEEKLENEYKFYQLRTRTKDKNQEKVPEMLLREATDETIKRLSEMVPNHSSILYKIRD
jgi:tRNA G10  N-methylase Trm11